MRSNHIGPSVSGAGSVLTRLRALLPDRPLGLQETVSIVELQAARLLHLQGISDAPVPTAAVSELPRVTVVADHELTRHAASGTSHWSRERQAWIISVNPSEPLTRQRFTVVHEYWHIIMHYHPGLRGPLPTAIFGLDPVEYLAEYFAGCVLMPKRWLKSAFYAGVQQTDELAALFDVSPRAMEVRLSQLGLRNLPEKRPQGTRYRLQSADDHQRDGSLRLPYRRAAASRQLQEVS